ncbi:glycosyltransferase family 4 protein [Microlunatus elymi]|uniref:Glycosyltransferase family 4 protein n=1 Tax=Microlunatus elymi TaxID=2596828 RepID=A0A516PUG4_9ACTN|nr:glycosyltransferase family 4 protein [Microlunatus elymi]
MVEGFRVALNVLFISASVAPHHRGGIGRFVTEAAHGLVAAGARVGICWPGGSWIENGVEVFGASSDTGPRHWSRVFTWQDYASRYAAAIERSIDAGPWHVVHLHDWLVAPSLPSVGRLQAPLKVATLHTDANLAVGASDQRRALRIRWERQVVECADALTVCSLDMARRVATRYVDSRVEIVPGGVNTQVFGRPLVTGRFHKKVLFFGQLIRRKGCDTFLRAVSRVLTEVPDLEVEVIGSGPEAERLALLAKQLCIESAVRFRGRLDGRELGDEVASASVACLPSREEPFGLAALEAMAAGAIVVASRTGGFVDFIKPGFNGFLCRVDDDECFADCMLNVLNGRIPYGVIARRGRETSDRYSWEAVAENLLDVYRATL